MSQSANEHLENFFGELFTTPEPTSTCCDATVYGELFKNFGRCSDCMEMAEFNGVRL